MLLAEAVDSGVPWADILVGMISAMIGGAIGVLGSLYVASNTEWFRKMSGWEPYATMLWEKRFAHYLRLAEMSQDLVGISRYMGGNSTLLTAAVDKMSDCVFDLAKYSESRVLMTDPVVNSNVLDVLDAAQVLTVKATSLSVDPTVAGANEDPPSILMGEVRILSEANRKLVSKLSSELNLLKIDWASAARFDEIGTSLPKATLERKVKEWAQVTNESN